MTIFLIFVEGIQLSGCEWIERIFIKFVGIFWIKMNKFGLFYKIYRLSFYIWIYIYQNKMCEVIYIPNILAVCVFLFCWTMQVLGPFRKVLNVIFQIKLLIWYNYGKFFKSSGINTYLIISFVHFFYYNAVNGHYFKNYIFFISYFRK